MGTKTKPLPRLHPAELELYQAARDFARQADAWEAKKGDAIELDKAAKALRHAAHRYHTRSGPY